MLEGSLKYLNVENSFCPRYMNTLICIVSFMFKIFIYLSLVFENYKFKICLLKFCIVVIMRHINYCSFENANSIIHIFIRLKIGNSLQSSPNKFSLICLNPKFALWFSFKLKSHQCVVLCMK